MGQDHHVEVFPANDVEVYIEGFTRGGLPYLERLLRRGDTALDVGANMGHFTVAMAATVGSSGIVHSFEASPETFACLLRNIESNGLQNTFVYPYAVTDSCGTVSFNVAPDGRSALSSLRHLPAARRVEVPAVSLDSMLDRLSPPVRLVKIDVEGAEFLVLRGMEKLIARDRPIIAVEVTDRWMRSIAGDALRLCGLVAERDYVLYRIERDTLLQLTSPPSAQIDMLCVPKELEQEVASRLPVR